MTTTPDDIDPQDAAPASQTDPTPFLGSGGDGVDTGDDVPLAPPSSPPAAGASPLDLTGPQEPSLAPPDVSSVPTETWAAPSPSTPSGGSWDATNQASPMAPPSAVSSGWPTPPSPPPRFETPSVSPAPPTELRADPERTADVVRAPRWVLPVVVLACLALFGGGMLAGWAIADRSGDSATPATTPGPTVTQPDGELLVPSNVEEPVAAVAQAVAPSVVQIETNFGLGSGIIMDDEGHILTAAHVIEGATQLRVRLADGTSIPAEIVGTSPETDVGVVRVDPRPEMTPAVLGVDAEVQVGQLAVAVGSPFGLQQTVTSGIVSALDRPVETAPTFRVGMIQTDASINPGNSGGALADRHGRVIGINDAIRTQGGGNEGVGFAIPIDLAASVADRLIAGEPVQSGFLGVSATDALEGRPGALIQEVTPGSPADEAGIEVGDLIVSVAGEPVRSVTQLRARILSISPGTPVVVEVVRDGANLEFDVVLASANQ